MNFYRISARFRVGNVTPSSSNDPFYNIFFDPETRLYVMRVRVWTTTKYKVIATRFLAPRYDIRTESDNSLVATIWPLPCLFDGEVVYGNPAGSSASLRYVRESSSMVFVKEGPLGHVPSPVDEYWEGPFPRQSTPTIYPSPFTLTAKGVATDNLVATQNWPRWESAASNMSTISVDGTTYVTPPLGVYLPVDVTGYDGNRYLKVGNYDPDTGTWSHAYAFKSDMYIGANPIRWM